MTNSVAGQPSSDSTSAVTSTNGLAPTAVDDKFPSFGGRRTMTGVAAPVFLVQDDSTSTDNRFSPGTRGTATFQGDWSSVERSLRAISTPFRLRTAVIGSRSPIPSNPIAALAEIGSVDQFHSRVGS